MAARRCFRAVLSLAAVAALAGFLAPRTAHAQKLFIDLYTGHTETRRSDLRLLSSGLQTDGIIRSVGFRGRPLEGSPYYGVRVGTFFRKQSPIGLDLELRHYKAYVRVDEDRRFEGVFGGQALNGSQRVSNFVQAYNITNGVSTVALNVRYRFMLQKSNAFAEGRIQPYVSAGPTYYILWPFNAVAGQSGGGRNYQGEGWGYQGMVGLRYGLAPKWFLFGEAGYSEGFKKRVDIAGGGTSSVNLNTYHVNFGVSYAIF